MLSICSGCTCRFAADLTNCPQCGHLKGAELPKITAYGGASNAADQPEPVPEQVHAAPETPAAEPAAEADPDPAPAVTARQRKTTTPQPAAN